MDVASFKWHTVHTVKMVFEMLILSVESPILTAVAMVDETGIKTAGYFTFLFKIHFL